MTHWSRLAERGGSLGLGILLFVYRRFGAGAVRLLLYPLVGYFYLSGRRARNASMDWLRRVCTRFGPIPGLRCPPGRRASFRHFLAFADASLDKLAAWSGRMEDGVVAFEGREAYASLIASGHGALVIGSHLGNLEMARALGTAGGQATINAVVYTQHAERFNRMMARANPAFGVRLLQVRDFGPDTAMLFQDKVERGELLFIVGDRTPASENGRVCRVPFLGEPAPFAQGPFLLAHLLKCPVYLFFCLKQDGRYQIHFELFAERVDLPRQGREAALGTLIARYAARLEHYCAQTPLQWFNFFDFWADTAPRTTP